MSEQIDSKLIPECNIGMLGHVSHGKTTLTYALTGKLTLTHSEELKRGITIRLGYADFTIYKCTKCNRYTTSNKCIYCFSDAEPLRTISILDAPGHETLMATVLTGTSLMDGAILVIAANEKCPRPQTIEHLIALETAGIKNVVIVQSKIDLVTKEEALKNYNEIKNFIKGTNIENAPIIPVSALLKLNIDKLLEAIEIFIPTVKRNVDAKPKMLIARSFDINKPGTPIKDLKGGVIGGSLTEGKLRIGDEIEIKPGIKKGDKYISLKTKIVGLQKAGRNLEEATAGGLLGVMTNLDPFITKSDSLVGNLVGLVGTLPESTNKIKLEINFIERILKDLPANAKEIKVGDTLLINVGTARSIGIVKNKKKKEIEVDLMIPVCIYKEDRVVISKQIEGRWRLIGYGKILE
jgi:translation initiation factor 2 subunit 3